LDCIHCAKHRAERVAIYDKERKILFAQMLRCEKWLLLTLRGLADSTLHRGGLTQTMAQASNAQSEQLKDISSAFGNFGKEMEERFGMLSFSLGSNNKNLAAEEQCLRSDVARLREIRSSGAYSGCERASSTGRSYFCGWRIRSFEAGSN
jgi:hypothetical protein